MNMKEGKTILYRQTVIYLPTFFFGDNVRTEKLMGDAFYYKLQQAILEYLATRQDYYFIWKGLIEAEKCWNPIPQWIKDRGFDNIGVETHRPFTKFLLTADKVICDLPGTGMYEAVAAGVPTMALCWRGYEIRETAREVFGEILQDFATYDEAIEHIKNFLDNDPGLRQVNIRTPDGSMVSFLVEAMRAMAEDEEEEEISIKGLAKILFSPWLIPVILTVLVGLLLIPVDNILAKRRAKQYKG